MMEVPERRRTHVLLLIVGPCPPGGGGSFGGMAEGPSRDAQPGRELGPRQWNHPGHQTLWDGLQWTMGVLVATGPLVTIRSA